jgi:SAM-dependent methyltransferase
LSLESWNQRYAAGEKLDEPHAPLVEQFVVALEPGAALDLACGPGRNAQYLAERGWRVTAVDGSAVALEHLRQRAQAKRLELDIRLADLERGEFRFPVNSYDLVLDILYLQRDLIPQIQSALRPGGLLIATVLLAPSDEPRPTPTRATPGELRALFRGWRVLHYRETSVAELVAAKPSASSSTL